MGTRSITVFMEDDKELCRIYRQFDGYPSGHGVELAKLCTVTMVNGFSGNMKMGTHANGMGCLAAQVIAGMKTAIGGIYLSMVGENPCETGADYLYTVRGRENQSPQIECLNVYEAKTLFNLPAQSIAGWVKRNSKKAA